jgi:hypothetical protein
VCPHEVSDDPYTWSRYEYHSDGYTSKGEPRKKKWMKMTHTGTRKAFMDEFKLAFKESARREFDGTWQAKCKETSEHEARHNPGTVVLTADFAQNPQLDQIQELQSDHWGKTGFSLYVVVCCYLVPGTNDVRWEAFHCITDHKSHTAHVVKFWTARIVAHLRTFMEVLRLLYWSDNCTGQFKGFKTWSMVALSELLYGCPLISLFTTPGMGKGFSDREIAVLKKVLNAVIATRHGQVAVAGVTKVISNAFDVFTAIQRDSSFLSPRPAPGSGSTSIHRRTLFHASIEELNDYDTAVGLTPIPGCMTKFRYAPAPLRPDREGDIAPRRELDFFGFGKARVLHTTLACFCPACVEFPTDPARCELQPLCGGKMGDHWTDIKWEVPRRKAALTLVVDKLYRFLLRRTAAHALRNRAQEMYAALKNTCDAQVFVFLFLSFLFFNYVYMFVFQEAPVAIRRSACCAVFGTVIDQMTFMPPGLGARRRLAALPAPVLYFATGQSWLLHLHQYRHLSFSSQVGFCFSLFSSSISISLFSLFLSIVFFRGPPSPPPRVVLSPCALLLLLR